MFTLTAIINDEKMTYETRTLREAEIHAEGLFEVSEEGDIIATDITITDSDGNDVMSEELKSYIGV